MKQEPQPEVQDCTPIKEEGVSIKDEVTEGDEVEVKVKVEVVEVEEKKVCPYPRSQFCHNILVFD